MKKIIRSFMAILSILIVGFSVASCGGAKDNIKSIQLNEITEEVNLITDKQQYVIDNYKKFGDKKAGLKEGEIYIGDDYSCTEYSRPNPVSLSWTTNENTNSVFNVLVSEYQDMRDAKNYQTDTKNIDIYNLKIGTTYYWQVSNANNTVKSLVSTFKTKQTPVRSVYVDGVTNVRDLGGKTTIDGTVIKQGLLYRGARYYTNYTGELEITEKGKNTLVNEIGLKTEIDIRKNKDVIQYTNDKDRGDGLAENANYDLPYSVAGKSVQYIKAPVRTEDNVFAIASYAENCDKVEIPAMLKVFETLADEKNYPAYFHCRIGTDRTGAIAYTLGAILGLDEDQLQLDYCYSMTGNLFTADDRLIKHDRCIPYLKTKGWYKRINSASGETLQAKAINTVKTIGVTNEQIKAFTKVMLGKEIVIPDEENRYLLIGKNIDAMNSAGTISYYKWDSSKTKGTFTSAPHVDKNGDVLFTIDTYTASSTPANDSLYIMYQPLGNTGDVVTISFDMFSTSPIEYRSSNDSEKVNEEANKTIHRELDYVIKDKTSTPFSVRLYFGDKGLNSGSSFKLSNFSCVAKAE